MKESKMIKKKIELKFKLFSYKFIIYNEESKNK